LPDLAARMVDTIINLAIDFLIAPALIFLILGGWVLIQHLSRIFAQKHPELGPAKEEGGGCGSHNCQHCNEHKICDDVKQ